MIKYEFFVQQADGTLKPLYFGSGVIEKTQKPSNSRIVRASNVNQAWNEFNRRKNRLTNKSEVVCLRTSDITNNMSRIFKD